MEISRLMGVLKVINDIKESSLNSIAVEKLKYGGDSATGRLLRILFQRTGR